MMNPYAAYQQGRASGWTRIDLLLALYDGAIERLDAACRALEKGETATAAPLLLRSLRIVMELLSGLDLRHGEVPRNLQALYAFVARNIQSGSLSDVQNGLRVLRLLRECWQEVRAQAIELERAGALPPVDTAQTLRATA